MLACVTFAGNVRYRRAQCTCAPRFASKPSATPGAEMWGCLRAYALSTNETRPQQTLQTVVGKGGPWLLPFLCRHFDLQPASTAIVGDRLDTDVATGIAGGLRTIMPLTGVCTLEDVMRAPPGEQPEFVVPSLVSLAGAAETGQVQGAV